MQAREVNVQLTAETNKDLTGTTDIILEVLGPTDQAIRNLSMTVSPTVNTQAIRLTTNIDFPVGGNYKIQLQATYADGRILRSPRQILHVGGL